MSIPSYMLYLAIYNEMVEHLKCTKFVLPSSGIIYNHSIPLFGGAVARLIATIAVAPLELLRTQDASMKHPRGSTQKSFVIFSDLTTFVRNEDVLQLCTKGFHQHWGGMYLLQLFICFA